MRDEELTAMISQFRAEIRDIFGAPKVLLKLGRSGVHTSCSARRESCASAGDGG